MVVPTSSQSDFLISESVRNTLPAVVIQSLRSLDAHHQEEFERTYMAKKQSFWYEFVLTFFSLHYLASGQIGKQLFFWFTFGGFGIWWLFDLISVSQRVDQTNRDLAMKVLRDIKLIQ